jgi:hypothetical protein
MATLLQRERLTRPAFFGAEQRVAITGLPLMGLAVDFFLKSAVNFTENSWLG